MKPNDKALFYKYLSKATFYFEYGSGGSTYQASLNDNIQKIYTVESDLTWLTKLKQNIKSLDKISFIYCDMKTRPRTYGNPGKNSTVEEWKNYSNQILSVSQPIDLILIDGRFRAACCLKCHSCINEDCIIAFDDFLNRPYYHEVLKYFSIVDKTQDNHMVFLKKIPDTTVDITLINKYELISQ